MRYERQNLSTRVQLVFKTGLFPIRDRRCDKLIACGNYGIEFT